MAQHTPGPWGLSEYGQIINPAATSLSDRFISVTGGVSTPGLDTAESNANRDLIVQAPETAAERDRLRQVNEVMLNALKDTINACFKHTNVCQLCDELTGHMDGCAVAAVERAIAAAEGAGDTHVTG